MAKRAAGVSGEYFQSATFAVTEPTAHALASSLQAPNEKVLLAHDRRELKRIMSDFVGIVRNEGFLKLALDRVQRSRSVIEQHYLSTPATYDVVELRNMATVSELIISSALVRKESRGLQWIEDYPDTDNNLLNDTIIPGALNTKE